MKLLLPKRITKKLKRNLRGRMNEIGGVMVGEHVGEDTFRIVDVSFQRQEGSIAHFIRDPSDHSEFLAEFFKTTGNDYKRFNYIGEWHSHPSFKPVPSSEDLCTMRNIVDDPLVGVNFAVLMIVRLGRWRRLEISATLFCADHPPRVIHINIDDTPDGTTAKHWVQRFLSIFT
jgi:proteasome lid subunit RPN8/RPN11